MADQLNKVDGYKLGHFAQYDPHITHINSYVEARGVSSDRDWDCVVNAGVHNLVYDYLSRPIVTARSLERMSRRAELYGTSFNLKGWADLLKIHNGMLPVVVEALPEGMVVPIGTPQLQIRNADRRFPWAGSWTETAILRGIWYPSTVATLSFHCKRIIAKYMDETAGHRDGLEFKLHDFGA